MKKLLINVSMIASLLAGTLGLTACSSEDYAFGAGVIVGVIVSDDGHRHVVRPAPYPGRGRRHGYVRPYFYNLNTEVEVMDNEMGEEIKAANHLNLSIDQAQVVMGALRSAQNHDFTKMTELGFMDADLSQLAKGENPSATTLRTLSAKLGIELGEAHDLIQTLKADLLTGLNRR